MLRRSWLPHITRFSTVGANSELSGTAGGSVDLQGVILDDAHTAFSNMREIFSLSHRKGKVSGPLRRVDYDCFGVTLRNKGAKVPTMTS